MTRFLSLVPFLVVLLFSGAASAWSPFQPARPKFLEDLQKAKLELVHGRRASATQMSFKLAATNKAERKALQAFHVDVLNSHVAETNAHLHAGKVHETAAAMLAAKRFVHDAYTMNRSSLLFTYPSGHSNYPQIRQLMDALESAEAKRGNQ